MATRKSARLKATAAAVATTQLVQNETQTTERTQGSRNIKWRKTSHEKDSTSDIVIKSNRRGIKRKIGDSPFLKDVPLDILIEIFRLLEPIDLLYLSRVSKSLHDLLSSNDMIFLWKLVYGNIAEHSQPPPCPEDINVVFYTNYLYGRHCQFCCSIYGQIYHDSALIRLCSKCADNGFLSVDELHPSVSCLCNVSTVPKRKPASQVVLKVEYDLRTKELIRACENKEKESYSTDRKVDVQNRASLSSHLGEWREGIRTIQLLQVRLIRVTRELDICKKLEEEGYKEDFYLNQCWAHRIPHVRKCHALTDSEWSIIRADILDYFQDSRDYQALYDMKEKLVTRVGRLEEFIHQWKIRPTAWWIVASSEPIASFIKNQLDEGFEQFRPQLRDLITLWKEEMDSYLTSLISDMKNQRNSNKCKINRLGLATTFFKCCHCTELITYPSILMHDCIYFEDESRNEEDDEDNKGEGNAVVNTRKPRGPREPRPPKHISADKVLTTLINSHGSGMCAGREGVSFDEEAFEAAWDFTTKCGENPNMVTHDTMKKARFECMRCGRLRANDGTRLAMKWPTVLFHELEKHKGEHTSFGPPWRKIEVRETKKKKKKQTT